MRVVRIGVLASGSGTILDAICAEGIPVAAVVVDRKCGATEVAERLGVEAVVLERTSYGNDFDRWDYTTRVADTLVGRGVDLVVMAGYGTVLEQPVHDAYPGRMLNTHPALLPSFPGWHGVEDALDYGVKVTGCTVHVVTLEVDAGPILAQQAVRVLDDDTAESLHERIKVVERKLYPDTIRRVLDGELALPLGSAA